MREKPGLFTSSLHLMKTQKKNMLLAIWVSFSSVKVLITTITFKHKFSLLLL